MKQWISRLTRVRTTYNSAGEQQQAQRLLILDLVWLFVFAAGTPLIIWWAVQDLSFANLRLSDLDIDTGTAFTPISLMLAGLTYWLIQHGQLNWARLCFVLNALVISLLTNFPEYRIDTPFIIVLTLPVTAAGVLLRRTGLFTVALFVIGVVAIGGYLQIATGMDPTPVSSPDSNESIQVTIFIVTSIVTLNGVILWIFVSGLEDTAIQQRYLASLIELEKNISQTLSALPATGEELNQAVEQIRDAFGLYHVQIFLTDAASGLAVLQASTGFIGRRLLEEESLLTPDEDSPVNDALRQTDPILIRENASNEKRRGFLPATRSELLIPLRVGTLLPMGVLDLHSTIPDTFSKSVLEILLAIGNHLAAALYAAQQLKDVRAAHQEREQFLDQLEGNQRELARVNRQLIGLTWGSYLEERRGVVPNFNWQSGTVAPDNSTPVLLDSTLQDGKPRLEMRDGEHILCIPIRLRGQTLGAVEFRRSSGVGWSPSALELAQAVADRMALSLENARLFEQAQTTAHREQLVSQITTHLQSTNNLQDLLTLAATQFQEALGATRTQVRLGLPALDSSTDQA